jgi:XRE family aerobic/anaerobic benzoate catabolism transcriptional regulator
VGTAVADLPQRIGSRVRRRRGELGLTVRSLSELSGLSARFLADVETGKANISIVRLADLAGALQLSITSLIRPMAGGTRQAIDDLLADCTESDLVRVLGGIELALGRRTPKIVALTGIRGAGKSAVGLQLAGALDVPFVELTDHIEARAGLGLSDIFTLHGEQYYRSLEIACFAALVDANEPCVVALPGGIVGSDAARELLRGSCTSVWLHATPEEYWDRVFAQGDTRPMAGRSDAMADLRALIDRREPLYRQADHVIDTSGIQPEQVAAAVLAALDAL